jgi:hypothetical protein
MVSTGLIAQQAIGVQRTQPLEALSYSIGDILDEIGEADRALLKFQRIVRYELTTRRSSKRTNASVRGSGRGGAVRITVPLTRTAATVTAATQPPRGRWHGGGVGRF